MNMTLYQFLHSIMINIDASHPITALYMDLSKAFDHVNHFILLNKQYMYGIRENAHNLVKCYLTSRPHMTHINIINITKQEEITYDSSNRTVCFGIQQGSVLGPLLLILYINVLLAPINHNINLFTDDSLILITERKMSTVESEMNNPIKNNRMV